MIHSIRALACAGMSLAMLPVAHANLSLVNYDGFEIRNSGNVWTFAHATAESTRLRGGTVFGAGGASVSTTNPLTIQTAGKIRVGTGAVVDVAAKVTRPSLAKAVARAAASGAAGPFPLIAGVAVGALADYLMDGTPDGYKKIDLKDGELIGYRDVDREVIVSDGYIYKMAYRDMNWTGYSPDTVCAKAAPAIFQARKESNDWLLLWSRSQGEGTCLVAIQGNNGYVDTSAHSITKHADTVCPPGSPVVDGVCGKTPDTVADLESNLINRLAQRQAWGSRDAAALKRVLEIPAARDQLVNDGLPQTSGPASVPGEKSQKTEQVRLIPGTNTVAPPGTQVTDPGTKTTTSTETNKLNYAGNTVTTITNVTNITNITNNVTNVTTEDKSEENKEHDKEPEEDPPTDTDLPPVPELYKRKYPDGLVGVWNTQSSALKSTSFAGLITGLFPSAGDGGCPQWTIQATMGPFDFGTYDASVPCNYWGYVRIILIVSSLIYARRLIFGG